MKCCVIPGLKRPTFSPVVWSNEEPIGGDAVRTLPETFLNEKLRAIALVAILLRTAPKMLTLTRTESRLCAVFLLQPRQAGRKCCRATSVEVVLLYSPRLTSRRRHRRGALAPLSPDWISRTYGSAGQCGQAL